MKFHRVAALFALLCVHCGQSPAAVPPAILDLAPPTLPVSTNGRHLQWSNGTLFVTQSETAWTLSRDCSREELEKYLENRQALRFNTIKKNGVEKCRALGRRLARRYRGNPGESDCERAGH